MTIPTRPAPAPPQIRNGALMAADDANARLDQLRLQLQQQQQQQQKISIKLPPPPKGNTSAASAAPSACPNRVNYNQIFNEFDNSGTGGSSITRKFPKVRYAPTTNWNDSPFEMNSATSSTTTTTTNGNFKKIPPPRPPPPKVIVNSNQNQKTITGSTTNHSSTNILTNIFHRKKSNANNVKQHNAARLYGVSSGNYAITTTSSHSTMHESAATSSSFTNSDWNSAWNNTTNNTYSSTSTITSQSNNEGQLISFDSPPSSPTFTQKSNSDCVSVDSFSSDSNFSSPQNGSVSQPESGFEDDFSGSSRSRPATTSPLDPWETFDAYSGMNSNNGYTSETAYCSTANIGTAPVRNVNAHNARANNTAAQDNPLCNGKSLLPPATSLYMPTIIKPKISQKPKAPRPPAFKTNPQLQGAGSALHTPPSPPMPQCAPPPPPLSAGVTLLDVISGKADPLELSNGAASADTSGTETPYGIALYDFEGAEEGDLTFRENDKIYLLERVSYEWYRGRTRSGCEGILPSNYIDVKIPLSMSMTAATAEATTTIPSTANSNTNANSSSASSLRKVRCLYNFPAEVAGDLALKENDMVTILYRINEDWLFGEINEKQGQFPANFLEYIPTDIPLP